MSRIFGEIRQNGYVVRDLERAIDFWTRVMGVGPFFLLEHVKLDDFCFRGRPSPLEMSLAMSNSGPLQIELIQQTNDAPSLYREFLGAGHEGLQHVAYWTEDFDAALARAEGAGFRVGQSGSFGADGRFVYFETTGHPGTVVELSEISGIKGRFFRAIADAARSWDGTDPIRRIPFAPRRS
jgi:catechol 2,3-dioxygenase-like lactoylglutathione lyase family enzyme